MRSTKAFLMGAGAAYFFDPRVGKRRRNELRDRSAAIVRRATRLGARKAKFAGGHARGLVAVSRRLATRPETTADDQKLVQRIRSEALRDVGVPAKDVHVEVDDGVAVVRGSVDSRELADGLVARVAKVPGVRDVAAMIKVSSGKLAA